MCETAPLVADGVVEIGMGARQREPADDAIVSAAVAVGGGLEVERAGQHSPHAVGVAEEAAAPLCGARAGGLIAELHENTEQRS